MKKGIAFDLSDRVFRLEFHKECLQPLMDAGVDLWWIDWQQGEHLKSYTFKTPSVTLDIGDYF